MTAIFLKPSPGISVSAAVLPMRSFPLCDDAISLRGRFLLAGEDVRAAPSHRRQGCSASWHWGTPAPSFLGCSQPIPGDSLSSHHAPLGAFLPPATGDNGEGYHWCRSTNTTWDYPFLNELLFRHRNSGAEGAGGGVDAQRGCGCRISRSAPSQAGV